MKKPRFILAFTVLMRIINLLTTYANIHHKQKRNNK